MNDPLLTLLKNNKKIQIKTRGQSMFPSFLDDDMVTLTPKRSPYKVNDIVLIRQGGVWKIHRIIYLKFVNKHIQFVVTKGDNNLKSDGLIPIKNIYALVTGVVRNNTEYKVDQMYLVQSTLYFQEIIKINKKFSENGVNYLILKGLPLHISLYKTLPKRIYADIDMLIDKQNYQQVENLLLQLGFEKKDNSLLPFLSKRRKKIIEIPFIKNINGLWIILDIHLEVTFLMTQVTNLNFLYSNKLIRKMTNDFLERKKIITIYGEAFPFLSDSDLVLYLLLHFFHHNYRGVYRLELIDKIFGYMSKETKLEKIISEMIEKSSYYKVNRYIVPALKELSIYFPSFLVNQLIKRFNISPRGTFSGSIFNDEARLTAGLKRFYNIWKYSPNLLIKKILILTSLEFWSYLIFLFFGSIIPFAKKSLKIVSKSLIT